MLQSLWAHRDRLQQLQKDKCITATYRSNGPLTLYLQSQLGVWTGRRIRGKNYINAVQFLAQTDHFVSLDLNVSSRATKLFVLSVYVFFLSQSREYHWLTLNDWQTTTFELNILVCVLLKKQSHLHLGCPWGKQINIQFSFFGWTIPLITIDLYLSLSTTSFPLYSSHQSLQTHWGQLLSQETCLLFSSLLFSSLLFSSLLFSSLLFSSLLLLYHAVISRWWL